MVINPKGKEYYRWQTFKKHWFEDHPPNHQGYYTCGICKKWVHESETVLDHIVPQGNTHTNKYLVKNIQPAHATCNNLKGSKRNYKHKGVS